MKVLRNLLTGIALLAVLFIAVGFMLPSEFRVERSIVINAPAEQVYSQLVDLRKWKTWGVWFKRDPMMEFNYTGPESAVGMTSSWQSDSEGSGEMKLIALEPNRSLKYSLYFPEFEMGSTGEFVLKEVDGQTHVTWMDYGDVGDNPINHYFAAMMDSMVGPDFETGLSNLKVLVENG